MPDSYIKHKKNCVLINGKNDINDEQHSTKNNENSIDKIRRPKVLVCHICGREFGLTSLAIHQKQCSIKFVDNEKKK